MLGEKGILMWVKWGGSGTSNETQKKNALKIIHTI